MNNTLFYNWFRLNQFKFNNRHYNDSRQGNSLHYVGYLIGGHAKFVIEQGKTVFARGRRGFIRGIRYQSYWYGNPVVLNPTDLCFPKRKILTTTFRYPTDEEQLNLIRQIQKTERFAPDIGLLYLLLGGIFDNFSIPDYQYNAIIKRRLSHAPGELFEFRM